MHGRKGRQVTYGILALDAAPGTCSTRGGACLPSAIRWIALVDVQASPLCLFVCPFQGPLSLHSGHSGENPERLLGVGNGCSHPATLGVNSSLVH